MEFPFQGKRARITTRECAQTHAEIVRMETRTPGSHEWEPFTTIGRRTSEGFIASGLKREVLLALPQPLREEVMSCSLDLGG